MSLLKRVEAAMPGEQRGKKRWIDRLPPTDRQELCEMRKRLHAGTTGASAAQLSRAISTALGGVPRPHTIVLWLHEKD